MKGVLAYKVEGRRIADTRTVRAHAVASCTCGAEGALTMPHSAHNPEAIGERFRRAGWEMNPFKPSSVRCPRCIDRHQAMRRAIHPSGSSSKVISMTTSRPTIVAQPTGGASPPAVTAEHRAKVRDLLTGVFDERGFYLDHYSDQRVAQECGVPAQMVREMRDAWLGPIKTVPELDALQADLAALRKRADTAIAEAREIDQVVAAMEKRLEETRRQLGVAA